MAKFLSAAQAKELETFCCRWRITSFALFGSVLREDFSKKSDIDVLISFSEGAAPDLFSLRDMNGELQALFGRKVDILTRKALESGLNTFRKSEILATAKVVYNRPEI